MESVHGVTLAGTLTLPGGAGPWPALVAVHGASEGTRDSPLLQHLEGLLPERGIATLTYDRRGEGDSTGVPGRASFDDLAADVRACIRYLRRHPEIDGRRVGLWCHSQGGFIAPLVAADDRELAFLVAVSPSGPPST